MVDFSHTVRFKLIRACLIIFHSDIRDKSMSCEIDGIIIFIRSVCMRNPVICSIKKRRNLIERNRISAKTERTNKQACRRDTREKEKGKRGNQ